MHKDKSELCIWNSFLRLKSPTTEKTIKKTLLVLLTNSLTECGLIFLLVFSDVATRGFSSVPTEDSQSRERLAQLNRFSRRVPNLCCSAATYRILAPCLFGLLFRRNREARRRRGSHQEWRLWSENFFPLLLFSSSWYCLLWLSLASLGWKFSFGRSVALSYLAFNHVGDRWSVTSGYATPLPRAAKLCWRRDTYQNGVKDLSRSCCILRSQCGIWYRSQLVLLQRCQVHHGIALFF